MCVRVCARTHRDEAVLLERPQSRSHGRRAVRARVQPLAEPEAPALIRSRHDKHLGAKVANGELYEEGEQDRAMTLLSMCTR